MLKVECPELVEGRYRITRQYNIHLKNGSVLKRSTRADCKSAGISLRGFKSLPAHHVKTIAPAIVFT